MREVSHRAEATEWSKIRTMFNAAQGLDDVVNFGIGEPDFDTPEPVAEAARRAIADGKTHYTSNAGIPELRRAIARKLAAENGVNVDPDREVIVTSGAMAALGLAMLATVNVNDEVALTNPSWTNYAGQATIAGGRTAEIALRPEDGFTLRADAVEAATSDRTRLLLVNTPANPTGAVVGVRELDRIVEIADARDFIIVSDEVYEHFVWDGAQHVSIASRPGAPARTITIGSFSKSYAMTGWRVGYAAGPEEIVQSMVKLQENLFACAPSVSQWAAVAALEEARSHLDAMIGEYRQRRQVALEILGDIPAISALPAPGSFYLFVNVAAISPSADAFAMGLLESEHVVVVPGSAFGSEAEGFVRLSYATTEPRIREGLTRMRRYVEKAMG